MNGVSANASHLCHLCNFHPRLLTPEQKPPQLVSRCLHLSARLLPALAVPSEQCRDCTVLFNVDVRHTYTIATYLTSRNSPITQGAL